MSKNLKNTQFFRTKLKPFIAIDLSREIFFSWSFNVVNVIVCKRKPYFNLKLREAVDFFMIWVRYKNSWVLHLNEVKWGTVIFSNLVSGICFYVTYLLYIIVVTSMLPPMNICMCRDCMHVSYTNFVKTNE
jgi:hypothetical protein